MGLQCTSENILVIIYVAFPPTYDELSGSCSIPDFSPLQQTDFFLVYLLFLCRVREMKIEVIEKLLLDLLFLFFLPNNHVM